MKINGKKIEGPNEIVLVIPRQDENIVFVARAVLNIEDFEKMCPPPEPPMMFKRGGRVPDLEHPTYKAQMQQWSTKQQTWLTLKSLEATEGLEWETVDMSDPSTWENFEQELRDSGFSNIEINRIILAAMEANSLSEAKLEEARERFFREKAEAQEKLSSHKEEVLITQSGEPVNDKV